MKKIRTQKGITLIALIITIVVLLILAVVTITSIQNDGLILYVNNSAIKYNDSVSDEGDVLQEYTNFLTNQIANPGSVTSSSYKLGQEVNIVVDGITHSFYVMKDSTNKENTVLLLAKGNINTTTLKQQNSDTLLSEEQTSGNISYFRNAAARYGLKLGGTGREMTYDEAEALYNNTTFKSKLCATTFFVSGRPDDAYLYDNGYPFYVGASRGLCYSDGYVDGIGVRPVIEISKSKIS